MTSYCKNLCLFGLTLNSVQNEMFPADTVCVGMKNSYTKIDMYVCDS